MIDGLVAMNAPPEIIYRAKARYEKKNFEDCEIWQDNEEAFILFEALATQWRISEMGGFLGIEYSSIEASMNMMAINRKRRIELFNDIRIMERAALPILNRKKDN